MKTEREVKILIERYPLLESVREAVIKAAELIVDCYSGGGKLLLCGNGGSSSDSEHVAGELMKSFEIKRPLDESLMQRLTEIGGKQGKVLSSLLEHALPAISLTSQTALITAITNDTGSEFVFAQQLMGYGNENDVLVALSTSGNSMNVVNACITAKALNMSVIALTGKAGGEMRNYCDVLINVPEEKTALIQELHLPVLHTLCRIAEIHFYSR